MTVLITGGAGLVGSECCKFFSERGWHVVSVDNYMRGKLFGEEASTKVIAEKILKDYDIEHHEMDIRDEKMRARATENPSLIGSFPRFIPKPTDVAIGRYLRYHPLELDPLFQFFCTEIRDTIIEDKGAYKICEFYPTKIPPIGICVFRKKILMKIIGNLEKFMDIDIPVILSKNGYNKFAYVSSCGVYHVNVKSLRELIQKRLRNIDRVYLPSMETREFKYFNLANWRDILKIFFWIIYANLFIPKFVKGVYKAFKNKDISSMYEPIVAMALTDAIVWGFLRNKNGRKFIINSMLGGIL